ncbi:TIGR04222 domain-containing membrane protein [Streptomyces sp. RS10V-4]|uniref:TIGR04222 domain-containing membrane protein n=1 Tax=Streptomyces rhizoryzae TaxID=2932493 RepID=UPI0020066F31|nr:TIGR04222 domain-containing membrane protein [Streptomyces rhizoryzae]MCK7626456.1 TIGR04222 domain-containing membrane protein [Streptomyces rhizoryzae]
MWLLFLLLAWAAAVVSCVRVCRRALAAGQAAHRAPGAPPEAGPVPGALTLYETAYLSGGPHRLADVVLVLMAQQRRLHLAHTGWATVVDPVGQDPVERAALTAIGPGGQSRIPAVRHALTTADAVRKVADRLVRAGLALPAATRTGIGTAVRGLRGAALVVLLAAGATYWMAPPGAADPVVLGWFALPLVLTLGTWAIARAEAHPYTGWATDAGRALLRHERSDGPAGPPGPAPAGLTVLALHGPAALADPGLRAALHSSGA